MVPEFHSFWNWLGWFLIVTVLAEGLGKGLRRRK